MNSVHNMYIDETSKSKTFQRLFILKVVTLNEIRIAIENVETSKT